MNQIVYDDGKTAEEEANDTNKMILLVGAWYLCLSAGVTCVILHITGILLA